MKKGFRIKIATALIYVLLFTIITDKSSHAGDTIFFCRYPGEKLNVDGELLNVPTVTVKTPLTPEIPLIEWRTSHFDIWENFEGRRYDPATRCEGVSLKFQAYYNCNLLEPEYITSATLPRTEEGRSVFYPVILTVNPEISKCSFYRDNNRGNIKGLLFMLPPSQDIDSAAGIARKVLQQLEDIRFYSDRGAIQN